MRTPALLLVIGFGALFAACAGDSAPHVNAGNVSIAEWDAALRDERLDPTHVEGFTSFRATVPADLPSTAYPHAQALLGAENRRLVQPSPSGRVELTWVIVNPDTKPHRESVVCFVERDLTPCHPQAGQADVVIPAGSFAFVDLDLPAERGDRVDLLRLPDGQVGQALPGDMVGRYRLAVGDVGPSPPVRHESGFVSERVWPWDGCDLARILKDEPPFMDGVRIPNRVTPDDRLWLLVEICQETQPVVIDLVLMGDRRHDASPPVAPWGAPFRTAGTTLLIPIERSWLGMLDEFQVAVFLQRGDGESYPGVRRPVLISDAVGLQ